MQKEIIVAAIFGAVTLTACSSKEDANEKNFFTAISQYLEQKGDLCLNTTEWPVDLSEADQAYGEKNPSGKAGQMAALEAVGLVAGEIAEVEAQSFFGPSTGQMIKVKRYTLTEGANPFIQERENRYSLNENRQKLRDICWGKKALDKIVKWEGPMVYGEYKEALIIYTYKIDNLADWAKQPEIKNAFPTVKRTLDGEKKEQSRRGVKLTSLGCESKGLN